MFLFSLIASSFPMLGHNTQTFKLITIFFHVDERFDTNCGPCNFCLHLYNKTISSQLESSIVNHLRWFTFLNTVGPSFRRPRPTSTDQLLHFNFRIEQRIGCSQLNNCQTWAIAKRGKERHNIRQHLDLAFFLLDGPYQISNQHLCIILPWTGVHPTPIRYPPTFSRFHWTFIHWLRTGLMISLCFTVTAILSPSRLSSMVGFPCFNDLPTPPLESVFCQDNRPDHCRGNPSPTLPYLTPKHPPYPPMNTPTYPIVSCLPYRSSSSDKDPYTGTDPSVLLILS